MKNLVEWKLLNLDIRGEIVPVIEDVRLGANIELWKLERRGKLVLFDNQKQYLENWLSSSGLKYRDHKSAYYICKNESLLDQLWKGEIKTGEFLGYPSCCIESFEKGCKKYLAGTGKGPAVEFWQSAKKAIEDKTFDPVLWYVIHAPCSLDCKKTLEIAEKIKYALELRDPEAAEDLKQHNKKSLVLFCQ